MNRCPTCHQIIPPDILIGGKKQRAIYELIKARPGGVTIEQLVHHLYSDDCNGGPDGPERSIHVMINHLNKKLRKHGIKISSVRGSNSFPYKFYTINTNIPSHERILWSEAAATVFSVDALYPSGTSGS